MCPSCRCYWRVLWFIEDKWKRVSKQVGHSSSISWEPTDIHWKLFVPQVQEDFDSFFVCFHTVCWRRTRTFRSCRWVRYVQLTEASLPWWASDYRRADDVSTVRCVDLLTNQWCRWTSSHPSSPHIYVEHQPLMIWCEGFAGYVPCIWSQKRCLTAAILLDQRTQVEHSPDFHECGRLI